MPRVLVIHVRLHDDRYHGAGEYPPSPGRLFQALVAGAGLSGPIMDDDRKALEWLEIQNAPIIGAPRELGTGQRMMLYMPNNDLNKVGGDPRRIADIRGAKKFLRPRLIQRDIPFLYAWSFEKDKDSNQYARTIGALAEGLYQLGRSLDMAWAWGEVLNVGELERRLEVYLGDIYRPSQHVGGIQMKCPKRGSLKSLQERYAANAQRFTAVGRSTDLRKPPEPLFTRVAYNSPATRYVYEIRARSNLESFAPWPLEEVVKLVTSLRDGAVERLRQALPQLSYAVDRMLVGRKPDGSNQGPTTARIRIVPLPSIGHYHADRQIRRVLIEVPTSCPLSAKDVRWAFSGLGLIDRNTGEVWDAVLVTDDDKGETEMLGHYGIDNGHRVQDGSQGYERWRSITPVVLPFSAARKHGADKDARDRRLTEQQAATAVFQALRHAGIQAPVKTIQLQREPFETHGKRAEDFASGTRFAEKRLWHVEITFVRAVQGPLIIGDGRFLGLGLMAPDHNYQDDEA